MLRIGNNWTRASRQSAGIAPLNEERSVIQVYAARNWGLTGMVADHTWLATKLCGKRKYWVVNEVTSWDDGNLGRCGHLEHRTTDVPDAYWFGARPRLLADIRHYSDDFVNEVRELALAYPCAMRYRAFPGPNSNTFTDWIVHNASINCDLGWRAIGQGYFKWPFVREPKRVKVWNGMHS